MTQVSCTGHIVEMNTELMILYVPSLHELVLLNCCHWCYEGKNSYRLLLFFSQSSFQVYRQCQRCTCLLEVPLRPWNLAVTTNASKEGGLNVTKSNFLGQIGLQKKMYGAEEKRNTYKNATKVRIFFFQFPNLYVYLQIVLNLYVFFKWYRYYVLCRLQDQISWTSRMNARLGYARLCHVRVRLWNSVWDTKSLSLF